MKTDGPGVLEIEELYGILLALHRFVKSPSGGFSSTSLSTLATIERFGAARITELATEQSVAQPTMTTLINRFERDGYVVRGDDPKDARSSLVSLTKSGKDVLKQRRSEIKRTLTTAASQLNATDRQRINSALPALLRLLQQPEINNGKKVN